VAYFFGKLMDSQIFAIGDGRHIRMLRWKEWIGRVVGIVQLIAVWCLLIKLQ